MLLEPMQDNLHDHVLGSLSVIAQGQRQVMPDPCKLMAALSSLHIHRHLEHIDLFSHRMQQWHTMYPI